MPRFNSFWPVRIMLVLVTSTFQVPVYIIWLTHDDLPRCRSIDYSMYPRRTKVGPINKCYIIPSIPEMIYSTSTSYGRRFYMARKTPLSCNIALHQGIHFPSVKPSNFPPLSFNDKVALLLFSFSERVGGWLAGWLAGISSSAGKTLVKIRSEIPVLISLTLAITQLSS